MGRCGLFQNDFNSLVELTNFFRDEQKCLEYLADKRWLDGVVVCPHCGCSKCYHFSDKKRFKCSSCRKQFNAITKTIFSESKISLKKWFIAIYLITSHKKGISSHQLARDLKITQKSAWALAHKIRYVLQQVDIEIELD